jgi:biopolymer transport protein ExbD
VERKLFVRCLPSITVTETAILLVPDGCDLWPPYRCGWNFFEIWRWMSFFQRLDVIALAVLLAYVVLASVYVSHQIRSTNKDASADLGAWLRILRSIAHVAPYLGLAGACDGIFVAFSYLIPSVLGIAAALAGALITTAAGLIVAVPATWFYNHFQSCINWRECRTRRARGDGFQVAQTLPLARPFSRPPAFSLVAIPYLGISALAFITLHSAFFFSKGLWVTLSPAGEPRRAGSSLSSHRGLIVIDLRTVKDGPVPDIYLNSVKVTWDDLGANVQDELNTRPRSEVYIRAQDEVYWAYVAEAIDVVKGLGAKVVLQAAHQGP